MNSIYPGQFMIERQSSQLESQQNNQRNVSPSVNQKTSQIIASLDNPYLLDSSNSISNETEFCKANDRFIPSAYACVQRNDALSVSGALMQAMSEKDEGKPLYVNAKQYDRIIKRREARAKLELEGRIPPTRKKFLHRSRHEHALKRVRGEGGRFASGIRADKIKKQQMDRTEKQRIRNLFKMEPFNPNMTEDGFETNKKPKRQNKNYTKRRSNKNSSNILSTINTLTYNDFIHRQHLQSNVNYVVLNSLNGDHSFVDRMPHINNYMQSNQSNNRPTGYNHSNSPLSNNFNHDSKDTLVNNFELSGHEPVTTAEKDIHNAIYIGTPASVGHNDLNSRIFKLPQESSIVRQSTDIPEKSSNINHTDELNDDEHVMFHRLRQSTDIPEKSSNINHTDELNDDEHVMFHRL